MTDQICRIVYYILYTVEMFLVGEAIFHDRVREKSRYAAMAVMYVGVIIPTVLYVEDHFWIEIGLNIAIYICLFQGRIARRLARFWGVYIFTNILESMICGVGMALLQPVLRQLDINVADSNWFVVLLAMMSGACALVIVKMECVKNIVNSFRALRWFQHIIISVIVLNAIFLFAVSVALLEKYGSHVGSAQYFATIVMMGAIIVGIVLFVYNVHRRDYFENQNRLKEEIICMHQQRYQKIYENEKELRKFRHDIRSHLGCLQLLLVEGKTEKAVQYLQRIGKHFEELALFQYHTGSEILDVIIHQKYLETKEKGIKMKLEGRMDKTDSIDDYDLCILFSNALDNCIEACGKMQNAEKEIMISVLTHRKVLFFRFSNPATLEMYSTLKQGKTSKADWLRHGYGVENIRIVVKRNGGELNYIWEEGILTLEIFFEI